jgi:leader peptidase (prepilin peptidase) / N-methyltransferase
MNLLNLFILVLGLVLGSFLNTQAIRLQHGISIWKRSSCDHCDGTIGIIGLIPVLGYLFLRGRCSKCRVKISPIYPLSELINGIIVWLIFSKTGWNSDFFYWLLIFESLFLVAIIDFRTHLIYARPILFGLAVQCIWLVFFARAEIIDSLFGLFIGAGVFHWVSYLYKLIRKKDGLGAGDATLLGLIGFILGWSALFPVIFWSSAIGIIGGGIILLFNRQSLTREIAFGPWLIIASFLVWRFPEFFLTLLVKMPEMKLPFF